MKVLFVEHCADDFLGGTANMDALTELAYRRICDLIYSTNDNLLDNDSLQYATKTGSKWKKIRQDLIEVYGKITVVDGYIRNRKCTEKLEKSRRNIEQKSNAGFASSKSRKSLIDNETTSTAVRTPVPTDVPTNQEPKNPKTQSIKKNTKRNPEEFEAFWRECPRKVGKGNAEKKYWIAREDEPADFLLQAMKAHAAEMKGREEQYIPHPATWLGQQRYYDETKITVVIQEKQEWPSWKQKIAATLGDHVVRGWFNTASLKGGALIFSRQFELNHVRQFHEIELRKLGIRELLLAQQTTENQRREQ